MTAGEFAGKVVFITGTGSGMGRAAALAFAAAGATVAGADFDQAGNAETKAAVTAAGGHIYVGERVDLTDDKAVAAWVAAAVAELGRIDVLYANAGATKFSPVADTTIDEWDWVLRRELDIVFLPVKYAWSHLKESRGNVVLVGSTAGVAGSMTNTRLAHSATKGGVIAMTKQLAAEGAPHGIRVNCVSPGMVATPATAGDLLAEDHPMKKIARAIPLGRIGAPEEIVECALFLASPRASYVTGANLMVDGGWSAVLPGFGML